MKWGPGCPICGAQALADFNGRRNARCSNCGSLERTRAAWLVMERQGAIRKGMRVLHLAPEPGLALRLSALASEYVSADYDISQYARFLPATVQVDLCAVDAYPFSGEFDLIVHNHVLEHLFCRVTDVLSRLSEYLRRGGWMYFSVPVRAKTRTRENLDPGLSGDERKRQFGQHDHVRVFGAEDVVEIFQSALGSDVRPVAPQTVLSEREMRLFGIPLLQGVNGHTVFAYCKPAKAARAASRAAAGAHAGLS